MGNGSEGFCSRLEEYMDASPNNTIFTDDLRIIIDIAESESDLSTAVKMMKRFHGQSGELRFSTFSFGPVVFRLFHMLRKPDLAYDLFMDSAMSGFFDQMSCYVILMDLLYESGEYDKVLQVFAQVEDRLLAGVRRPIDCAVLALAACFKMNTAKSYEETVRIVRESNEAKAMLSPRCVFYASLHALKQALCFAQLNRPEDANEILRSVMENDDPDHVPRGSEIFEEVLQQVKEAVESHADKDIQHTFETISKSLHRGGHVNSGDFEAYMLRPIVRKRKTQDGYKQRSRPDVGGGQQQTTFDVRLPGRYGVDRRGIMKDVDNE